MPFIENLNSFEKQSNYKVQLFQIFSLQISSESVIGFVKWII